jgi:hypothetical protein
MKLRLAVAFAVSSSAAAPAAAQEILLTGPLALPRPRYWAGAVPAELEWTYWVAGGAARETGGTLSALGGLGGELTVEVLRYHGFPSGYYGRKKGDAELRVGPWASAATRSAGGLVEGGLKLHFGGIYHASFGTWDLRLGGGYGAFEPERAAHVAGTLAYGVRSVPARYAEYPHEVWQEVPPRPRPFAEASVARVFVTLRRAFDDTGSSELSLGVELSPTFLLPPYSWFKLGGGPPR